MPFICYYCSYVARFLFTLSFDNSHRTHILLPVTRHCNEDPQKLCNCYEGHCSFYPRRRTVHGGGYSLVWIRKTSSDRQGLLQRCFLPFRKQVHGVGILISTLELPEMTMGTFARLKYRNKLCRYYYTCVIILKQSAERTM